jgi:hypothetical protein
VAGGEVTAGGVSAKVLAIKDGILKAILLGKLKIGILFLAAIGLATAGTGLIAHQVIAAMQQKAQTDDAAPRKLNHADSADNRTGLADAEMHVIGLYGPKGLTPIYAELNSVTLPVRRKLACLESFGPQVRQRHKTLGFPAATQRQPNSGNDAPEPESPGGIQIRGSVFPGIEGHHVHASGAIATHDLAVGCAAPASKKVGVPGTALEKVQPLRSSEGTNYMENRFRSWGPCNGEDIIQPYPSADTQGCRRPARARAA